jgi:hypothetical protein
MKMSKQQEIEAKVNELSEAVAAAEGGVMVIGIVDGEAEGEKVVIGALRGKGAYIVEALAKILTSSEGAAIERIMRTANAAAALHKIVGGNK